MKTKKQFCVIDPVDSLPYDIHEKNIFRYTSLQPEEIGPLSERFTNSRVWPHEPNHIVCGGIFYRDGE